MESTRGAARASAKRFVFDRCLLAPCRSVGSAPPLFVAARQPRPLMSTLEELVRLHVKLLELSLVVEDNKAAQASAVTSPNPTPTSSPKPARLLSSSQSLIVTPVVQPAHKARGLGVVSARAAAEEASGQPLDGVQADVTSVSSAILQSKNITFRTKAPGQAALRSPCSLPPLPPRRGGVASPVAPRRRMTIVTSERDGVLEDKSLEPSCCCIDVLQPEQSTVAAGDEEAGSKSGRQMRRSI